MTPIELIEIKLGEALGIRPRRGSRSLLERSLERVRSELRIDLDEIARRIDTDPVLVRRLAGAITVEETFFFRHPEHFQRLIEYVRAHLARPSTAPIILWSAGCSSGEEPYSMAIALQRAFGPAIRQRVSIVASDVDQTSLEKANRGVYGTWSFRGTDPGLKTEAFEAVGRDEYRVLASIREAVQFEHRTLEQQLLAFPNASVDAVFFRNVAIYLTESALEQFFRGLSRVMKEGALLIVGPADPIPASVDLRHVRIDRGLSLARNLPLVSYEPSPASMLEPAKLEAAAARRPAPTEAILVAPLRPTPTRTPVPRSPSPPPPDAKTLAAEALDLADRGRLVEAIALLDRGLSTLGPSSLLLGVRGRVHIAASSVDKGVEDLRSALFLSSSDLLLRFHYAIGLEMQKRHRIARGQVLDVLRALEASCDHDLLTDGETTAGALRRAAAELLRRIE